MVKFKVWKAIDGQFYAHVLSANGQILMASEGYKVVRSAFKVCERVWHASCTTTLPVPYARNSLLPRVHV